MKRGAIALGLLLLATPAWAGIDTPPAVVSVNNLTGAVTVPVPSDGGTPVSGAQAAAGAPVQSVNSATGATTTMTALMGDCAAGPGTGSISIICTKTNGSLLGTMATQAASAVAITGGTVSGAAVTLPSSTVSGLPTCNAGATGRLALVTDALLPAILSTVAGSGAVKVQVLCNGSNWIVS